MTSTDQREMLYCTAAKRNQWVDVNARWEEEHKKLTRCVGCNGWRGDLPLESIHAVLDRPPPAIVISTGLFMIAIDALAELFVRHGRAVLGSVMTSKGRTLDGWRTLFATDDDGLEAERGSFNRHSACPKCGRLRGTIGWAHPVILRRYLDDRWFYLGTGSQGIYLDRRLVEQEKLPAKYPSLRLFPVPIIPEPQDGQTMPGDPGWTGTFVPVPKPAVPAGRPEKGIGSWLDKGGESVPERAARLRGEGEVTLYIPERSLAASDIDLEALREAIAEHARGAVAGTLVSHGVIARRRAWHVRLQGPNMTRLVANLQWSMRPFQTRLPKGAYIAVRQPNGHEERLKDFSI